MEVAKLMHVINWHPDGWRMLRNRWLKSWGGFPQIKGMISAPLSPFLNSNIFQLGDSICQAHVHTRRKDVFINISELVE